MPADVVAGRVGRPHGLDGAFHVTFAVPGLLARGRAVRVGDRSVEVVAVRGTAERPVVRLAGVGDRTAAEALRGAELLVAREEAPALEEDEWYAADLVGCRVVDGGVAVGEVQTLVPLPSCEALEVARPAGGGPLLVPLIRDAVRSVDVEAGVIDVDLGFLGESP